MRYGRRSNSICLRLSNGLSYFSDWISFEFTVPQRSSQILEIAERARPAEPYMALHLRRGRLIAMNVKNHVCTELDILR